ncbi:d(CMP) kinase [Sphingomonas sp. 1P06PA]|uniref:(d)CMP kinase n=1 Tax=Sphingomonas sp. 1P06PA TaxID=554121 RepID=UPI0039A4FB72
MNSNLVIAVDGPAASGKGTIARALAAHYGLPHLDTGLLYRAVGLNVLRGGGDPADPDAALAGCRFDDLLLTDPKLRSEQAGGAASIVSAHPAVRTALIERQRDFAARPGGAVLDGRDIGTVIAPDATAKLYVRATPSIRAKRRQAELRAAGIECSIDKLTAEIRARDFRDQSREVAPLRPAPDALELDTSFLSIDAAVEKAIALVESRRTLRGAA